MNYSNLAQAAFSLSGQNEVRYGSGRQANRFPDNKLKYLENYLELTGSLDNLRFYIRQAYRIPSEYDVRTEGLDAFDKMYIEYTTDHLTLRGGDFYRTWGKGLFFGNQELRDVNIDTGLEGVLVEGNSRGVDVAAFRGVEADTLGGALELAEGIWVGSKLPFETKLGIGYATLEAGPRHPMIDRHGFEVEKDFEFGNIYASYVSDRLPTWFVPDQLVTPNISRFNHALFTAATVYGNGWSFYLDFRSYQMFTYQELKPIVGYVIQTPLQNPPIGRPENTMYLLDHYARALRYDDDVGFQGEFTANLGPFDWLLNYHQSTRADKGNFVSKHADRYSPYEGLFLRSEYATPWEGKAGIKYGWQRDVDYDYIFNNVSKRSSRNALGLSYETELAGGRGLSGDIQAMGVKSAAGGIEDNYWEQYLSGTYSQGGNFSITGTLSRSESPQYAADGVAWGKDFIGGNGWYWPSADLVVGLFEQHQLRLFYGYERGGISCAGGVCHIVNPFKGVKLSLTSHF